MENILSESLMNSDQEQIRDPFVKAKNQYESKVLSSSLVDVPAAVDNQEAPPDMNDILSKMGVESSNLAMNDIGRFQLIGRLETKYGPNYINNPEAIAAIDAFDKNLEMSGVNQKQMNQSLSNANRTLGMLFGKMK